ncbi:MAG TPA: ATP-binding protein [Acidimicrobiales bacterium]|nr:ATP-binding protein [Acidimicrobiales bacterium]
MPALVDLALGPAPVSPGIARRAVAQALRSVGASDDLVDTTSLLVSEVVTNAVLHAGTAVRLRCAVDTFGARIEVADESSVVPSSGVKTEQAATGRGMSMVETLATESGVRCVDGGKVVWFVVGERVRALPDDGAMVEATYTVRFLDVPVGLALAGLSYGEAVLREVALLALGGAGEGRWQPPRFNLGPLLARLQAAAESSEVSATFDTQFPVEARDLCLERLALVEEGHQLAREGKLLAAAAVPEVIDCRRWIYRQIHAQADGAAPERWSLPDDHSEIDIALDPRDAVALDGPGAVIAADDNNRIVFVNAAAEVLLGSRARQLVGRRLTAVVPPEWRLAHLAGFARFQLTGESHIIGRPVTVRALRADRSTTAVDLHIEPVAVNGGRVFRATLEPIDGGPDQLAAPA